MALQLCALKAGRTAASICASSNRKDELREPLDAFVGDALSG